MWEDMGLYWAFRGQHEPKDPPPYSKRIIYASVLIGETKSISMRIACAVVDGGEKRIVNLSEIEWLRSCGAEVNSKIK